MNKQKQREYYETWKKKNPKYHLKYGKIYREKNRERFNEYHRKYREANKEKYREYTRIYNTKWRKANGYHNELNSKLRYPEKEHARKLLQYAVKSGRIIRGTCEVCGKEKAQGHHDDYLKPLEVKWFCPIHHIEYEKKNGLK